MNDYARTLSALHALDAGCGRQQWVRIGMAAKAAGLSLEDFTAWSSSAGNYAGERDCATVWRSFDDGPVKAGTLYALSFAAGWNDPTTKSRQAGRSAPKSLRPMPSRTPGQKIAQRPNTGALALWECCGMADAAQPYIVAKRGTPDDLRVVPADHALSIAGHSVAGWLVVPAWSLSGELRTLQLIPQPGHGKKLNLPGASFDDGMFVVGNLSNSGRIYIVEGIGQAWAVHRATDCAAVICFGAGRMGTVAELLRRAYPSKRLIVVPDRGKEQQAEAIARAIRGQWVELPADKPANYDANDYALEHSAEALADLLAMAKSAPMRYRLLAADDLMAAPPLRWLVRGVLPAAGLAAAFGASGSGKSFLALDLCAAVADGADWFGCRVTRAPVSYCALEGEHGFRQRVLAWQEHHGRNVPDALRFVMQPFDLRDADDVGELAEAVIASSGAGGLLVLDTLNRAASGADENASADMGEIIEAAKALQAKLGGLVLLVHHSGKDATKGMRGHSSLHAALDAAIEVSRTDDRREWRIAKSKDGSDGEAHAFHLHAVEIGSDDGEAITSCVVVPDDEVPTIRRVLPPKSGNQRVIWDALGELLRQAGDMRPKDAPDSLPVGRPTVTLEAAIDRIRERLACDPKRKTERTQQALTGLQAKRLIVIDGGYVWMA